MFISQTTGPDAWITLAECKMNARVDHDTEDDLIMSLATSACRVVQERVGKLLGSQAWSVSLHGLSGDEGFRLPFAPVASVTAITYQDADDATQSLDVSDFYLFGDDDRAILKPKAGTVWPVTYDRPDALTITVSGGMTTVPETLRQAALMLVAHWYETRAAAVPGQVYVVPHGVSALIDFDRVGWVRS